MDPHVAGIYCFGMTADSSKVKHAFAFLDKVFHPAAVTVKPDDLTRHHIHVCNNKGVHMRQLAVWFLDLEDHTSWIIPGAGLIQEFAISYRITDLVIFGCFVQVFFFIRSKGNE